MTAAANMAGSKNLTAAAATQLATDDEILGIDTRPEKANSSGTAAAPDDRSEAPLVRQNGADGGVTKDASTDRDSGAPNVGEQKAPTAIAEPPELKAIFDANPELRRAWRDEKAYREIFPTVEAAREIQKIFPTVEDARSAGQQLAELAQLDGLFFSGRPEAYAELARFVERMDPQAFRSLASAMAEIEQARVAPSFSPPEDLSRNAEEAKNTTVKGDAGQGEKQARGETDASRRAAGDQDVARQNAFAGFYQEANAAAVQEVVEAIKTQVERLLPEGVAAGARNRVIGEIYRELDASLRGNRALGQQVRQAFRSGNLDAEHQRAVVGLIAGRARQALPGVAKKVIGEWTTSVLAASNARVARQRAAESRVDLTGGGAPGTVSRRPLSPDDIDYAKMSDADILNL